jgi:hypothetical protein
MYKSITVALFLLAATSNSAFAQDWKVWVDFSSPEKRTTGYWLIQGTDTPEMFINRQYCEERAQAILGLLQSLRVQIHSVRCRR